MHCQPDRCAFIINIRSCHVPDWIWRRPWFALHNVKTVAVVCHDSSHSQSSEVLRTADPHRELTFIAGVLFVVCYDLVAFFCFFPWRISMMKQQFLVALGIQICFTLTFSCLFCTSEKSPSDTLGQLSSERWCWWYLNVLNCVFKLFDFFSSVIH